MKTGILIFCLSAMATFISLGCGDSGMCDEHKDCISMCKTYEQNDLLVVCTPDKTCLCLSQKDLSCTESVACTPICEKYKPGSTPACVKEICQCLTEDAN